MTTSQSVGYSRNLLRGTKCMQLSKNFKDLLSRYSRKQLKASFFGTKEWYYQSQMKMAKYNQLQYQDVVRLSRKATGKSFI
jgi:hypothetical protein